MTPKPNSKFKEGELLRLRGELFYAAAWVDAGWALFPKREGPYYDSYQGIPTPRLEFGKPNYKLDELMK